MAKNDLAIFGGRKSIPREPARLFSWPIVTRADEKAVLAVLRKGQMSEIEITQEFEKEFAAWNQVKYALGHNNGTSSIQAAMFGCGVGVGDEVICPSVTYWASALPAFALGASLVFADIDPNTLCIDPNDIEHRITERTRAIVVVHCYGHPVDMDPILAIARRHNVKVIEDVSHAQGGLYKGRKLGTLGDVAGISIMSGKALACGEAGMLVTNDREIYERAIAWGHYERFNRPMQTADLNPFLGLPMGGCKNRMHQLSAAMGRVQLRSYEARSAEIRNAMNHFWDLLEGTPGIKAHRTPKYSGSTMGGWYWAVGLYRPEELAGLSVTTFCEAVRAEGFASCLPGVHNPLHTHPLLQTCDVYHAGKPTRIANSGRDVRLGDSSLPVSETIVARTCKVPWFKHYEPRAIEQYARAFRKVAENHKELLAVDKGNPPVMGQWSAFKAAKP